MSTTTTTTTMPLRISVTVADRIQIELAGQDAVDISVKGVERRTRMTLDEIHAAARQDDAQAAATYATVYGAAVRLHDEAVGADAGRWDNVARSIRQSDIPARRYVTPEQREANRERHRDRTRLERRRADGGHLIGMRLRYRSPDSTRRVEHVHHDGATDTWIAWCADDSGVGGVHEQASSVEALERRLVSLWDRL